MYCMHFTKCLKFIFHNYFDCSNNFWLQFIVCFQLKLSDFSLQKILKIMKIKKILYFTQATLLIIKNLKISSIFFVTTRLVFSTKTMLPRIDTSQILVNWILIFFFPYIMCKNWRWFLLGLCKKEIKTTLREVSVFNVPGLAHLLTLALVVKIRTIQFLKPPENSVEQVLTIFWLENQLVPSLIKTRKYHSESSSWKVLMYKKWASLLLVAIGQTIRGIPIHTYLAKMFCEKI